MSALLDLTLELANQKVRFFPVKPDSKLPAITDFAHKATCDEKKLRRFFENGAYNSGIACGLVTEGLYLVGFDIDNKDGRNGFDTLDILAQEGRKFPETWAQTTPSGGEHRLFWSPVPIRQGTNVCGLGVDFRGDGGYLVGPGSSLGGKKYMPLNHNPIAMFPPWAILAFEKKATVIPINRGDNPNSAQNQTLALKRSVEYLQSLPPALQGSRNDSGYKAICKLKDFGLAESQALDIMLQYWKCDPMLGEVEIMHLIGAAYKYGRDQVAVDAPENIFESVPTDPKAPKPQNPVLKLNDEFFYVAEDTISRVYWETEDKGRFYLHRFSVPNFHERFKAMTMVTDSGTKHITQLWMNSASRRTYDRLRFDPSGTRYGKNVYNLWKGFAAIPIKEGETADPRGIKAVEDFFLHCKENICDGDEKLNEWFLGFLADMFQNPGEKPQVALVFKGRKGTGKSIVVDILSHLIGDAAVTLADRNHISNHFNSILESKILVALDEAFWSGDKSVEGILKSVITGKQRVITHKGKEPYPADVFDRIFIIGNDDWLVPATADERRFAVFNVGEGKRQDQKFFVSMKDGIFKHGGDRLLIKQLLERNYSKVDINYAPQTKGLMEQKAQSLGVVEQWWFECLTSGQIKCGVDFEGEWPTEMKASQLYDYFREHAKKAGQRYTPSFISFRKQLAAFTKNSMGQRQHKKEGNNTRVCVFSPLEVMQDEWDMHFGIETDWD